MPSARQFLIQKNIPLAILAVLLLFSLTFFRTPPQKKNMPFFFARVEVDNRNNIGDSAIISAGQESGGALWEYEVDKGTSRVVDCHFKLRRFDGQRNPHFTLAYSGQRYSVVAYIHRGQKMHIE